MPFWVIAAGLGSIAITALLTFVLWRMNAPTNTSAGSPSGDDASSGGGSSVSGGN